MSKERPLSGIIVLGVVFFAARVSVALIEPSYSFVDDKAYLTAALQVILEAKCSAVPHNLCNYEHPPLAKAIVALGLQIFDGFRTTVTSAGSGTEGQLGGRFFQIVMGASLSPISYLLVKRLSGNTDMAVLAALFVLVDPLLFSLSLTTGLDVPMVFFGVLALLPYAYRTELWRLDSFALTGGILGLSLLSKETGVFVVLAVVTFHLLAGDGVAKARLVSGGKILAGALVVFVLGLQLYDAVLSPFPTFLNHLDLMVAFHLGDGPAQIGYFSGGSNCFFYQGLCSTNRTLLPHFLFSQLPPAFVQGGSCTACWSATNPLDWLTYFPPVSFPTALVLAPNYPLIWTAFLWVPLAIWKGLKRSIDNESRMLVLAASVFVWNTVSNLWLYAALDRAVFEWYMLPSLPACAFGAAYLLSRTRVHRPVKYVVVGCIIAIGLALSPAVYHALYPQPQSCPNCG